MTEVISRVELQSKDAIFGSDLSFKLAAAAAGSLIALALHFSGCLFPLEALSLDTASRLAPLNVRNTFVVAIKERDYENMFASRSPLDANKVFALITAIDRAHPKAIVVDLDTSDSSFRSVPPPVTVAPVIWARTASLPEEPGASGAASFVVKRKGLVPSIVPSKFLGADAPPGLKAGVSALVMEPDGVIRSYYRHVPAVTGDGVKEMDALWWLAAKAANPALAGEENNAARVMRVAPAEGAMPTLQAGDYMKLAVMKEGNPLSGKIVVLGGNYEGAREVYMTAQGPMFAPQLIAQAIEAESTQQSKATVGSVFLVASAGVAALVYELCAYGRLTALAVLIGTPVLGAVLAGLQWTFLNQWFNFVPAVSAVYSCALINHIRGLTERNQELENMNAELARARWELGSAIDRGAEQERKDIADGLHDEMLPKLQHAASLLEPLTEKDISIDGLEPALSTLKDARVRMRRLMKGLNPPSLEVGLVDAIDDLILDAGGSSLNIKFRPTVDKQSLEELDKNSTRRIFRIVQEAINNIDKHAEATEAQINLSVEGEQLVLIIADNGKGLPERGNEDGDSYGLFGMRTKAELLDAEISWASPNDLFGRGTAVTLRMPLKKRGRAPG